jgi:hypothetical protein
MPTITLFDANGKVLKQEEAKSKSARFSIRAAAWQRQLDSLFVKGAITATIGNAKFTFDANGNSRVQFIL